MKVPALVTCALALALLGCVRKAVQPSGSFLNVVGRVVDLSRVFGIASPTDVKRTDRDKASCDMSLKAHSDRVLSEVKNPLEFVRFVISGSDNPAQFEQRRTFENKTLVSQGCSTESVSLSIHARLGLGAKLQSYVHFTLDLPPPSELPLFRGEVDRRCRIKADNRARKLFLEHVDIYPLGPVQDVEVTNFSAMVLGYGARGILLDVNDDALVDTYVLLYCKTRRDLGTSFVELRSNVRVGDIRRFLMRSGIRKDRARSFMVAGFYPKDF